MAGMPDSNSDWKQVAEAFSGLALKLKMHYEQAAVEGESAEVKQALDRLGDAVDGAFDAMRNAVKDPAVKEDVRQVSTTLRDALANSFSEVSDDLRDSFRRRRGGE